ncbi:MAG: penicillin-binding protein activator [Alphaproteobacteria bacterium]|nr:penicillin-binding protein activator [Alphaproteobacteria bacterium]
MEDSDQTTKTAVQKAPLAKSTLREQAFRESVGKIRVAILLPLSGSQAKLGQGLLNAAQMSVFENADDNFELLIYDTKGNGPSALKAAQTAIDKGAQIILGPLFSQEVKHVAPHAVKYGVPVISFSNDQQIAGHSIFTMGFSPSEQIQRLMETANSRGLNRVAALIPTTPYGKILQSLLEKQAAEKAVTLTTVAVYKPGITDFSAQASQIKASHPQALLIPEGGRQLQLIVSSLLYHDLNLHQTKLLGTGQWDTPEIADNENILGGWFVGSPPENRQRFEQSYQAMYKEKPSRLATLAYDAVSLAAVLARNTKTSPFQISLLTQPRGFAGIDGVFRLLPDGTVERKLAVLEVTENGLLTISPAGTGFENLSYDSFQEQR